ncbi:MAG: hypothetical protein J2P48_01050 [Alphaproteobacteria bacterium]|nr:hypothetical protein [Alphaproteobacteria bacterium]
MTQIDRAALADRGIEDRHDEPDDESEHRPTSLRERQPVFRGIPHLMPPVAGRR